MLTQLLVGKNVFQDFLLFFFFPTTLVLSDKVDVEKVGHVGRGGHTIWSQKIPSRHRTGGNGSKEAPLKERV